MKPFDLQQLLKTIFTKARFNGKSEHQNLLQKINGAKTS